MNDFNSTDYVENEDADSSSSSSGQEIPTSWCMPSAGCHDNPSQNGNAAGNLTRLFLMLAGLIVLFIIGKQVVVYLCLARQSENDNDDDKTVSMAEEEGGGGGEMHANESNGLSTVASRGMQEEDGTSYEEQDPESPPQRHLETDA